MTSGMGVYQTNGNGWLSTFPANVVNVPVGLDRSQKCVRARACWQEVHQLLPFCSLRPSPLPPLHSLSPPHPQKIPGSCYLLGATRSGCY